MFTCGGCGITGPGRPGRAYCSNACQAVARRALVEEWLRTGVGRAGSERNHYVRTYLLEAQGGRCAICDGPSTWHGLPLTFVLDHLDGDHENNRRDNLRLICPNCDSQLPTFKNRNRGRGRAARRRRYLEGKSY